MLAYTPMFHARLFAESAKYRDAHFEATRAPSDPSAPYLDGNPAFDRPLFVQFCANDPAHLLAAARLVAPHCDAVDLNLGCPQGIARKGRYGAFLQEDQALVHRLVRALADGLPVPVTAKIRVLDTPEATLAYARNVLAAGASVLAVHGRRRDQKGHYTGLADWRVIRYLRDNLPADTVLFANGNVLTHADLERCLAATGADAVMSAEGNLSDPAIFAAPPPEGDDLGREYWRGHDGKGGYRVDAVMRRYMDILHRYVLGQEPPQRRPLFLPGDDAAWLEEPASPPPPQPVHAQPETTNGDEPARKKRKQEGRRAPDDAKASHNARSSPNLASVQAHLFHLLRHLVARHTDVRDALARARKGDLTVFEGILDQVERKIARGLVEHARTRGRSIEAEWAAEDAKAAAKPPAAPDEEGPDGQDGGGAESSVRTVRACRRPWWIVQPIVRPLPREAMANGAITLKGQKSGAPGRGKAREGGTGVEVEARGRRNV